MLTSEAMMTQLKNIEPYGVWPQDWSFEEKVEWAKVFYDGGWTVETIARCFGVPQLVVQEWLAL